MIPCRHCEKREAGSEGFCRSCDKPNIRAMYHVPSDRPAWWDKHLDRLRQLANQELPLFPPSFQARKLGEGCD